MRTGPAKPCGQSCLGERSPEAVCGRAIAATALIALATLVFLAMLPPPHALASASVSRAREAARELQEKVAVLNAQLADVARQYDEATGQLAIVKARVASNERRLGRARHDLAVSRRQLARRAVAMYKERPTVFLDVLLATRSFDGLLAELELMRRLSQQDAAIVARITALKREIQRQHAVLVSDQREVEQVIAQVDRQKTRLASALQSGRELLSGAQARVRRLVKAERDRKAREAAARAAAAAQFGVAITATAGDYTPSAWALALLRALGMPTTSSNVTAIVAWEMAEGGHWLNSARYNPLNTTLAAPGATDMNWVGVKAYTSWAQGLQATVATLQNGLYGPILAALRAGDNALAVAQAVGASRWGTGYFGL